MRFGKTLALIPARSGSKGLPGKNIRPLRGLPLIAHSILLAKMCSSIARVVVSTDGPEIAEVAGRYGAEVPFIRPPELAADDTPMWAVVRHAMETLDPNGEYAQLLLLDPTTPGRLPSDVEGGLAQLSRTKEADGVIGVSVPDFNPIWHCVTSSDGWMEDFSESAASFSRRQDLPTVYRINASLYVWRREFIVANAETWRKGRLLLQVVPEVRSIHVDTLDEFRMLEACLSSGLIEFPWLQGVED